MLHYDEVQDLYYLIVKRPFSEEESLTTETLTSFALPTIGSLIGVARNKFGVDLLTQLN